MSTLRVKPAEPGLVIPKPEGGRLAADGEEVPNTEYWRRRRLEGDVVEADADEPAEAEGSADEAITTSRKGRRA
jgi:hypothetical protein